MSTFAFFGDEVKQRFAIVSTFYLTLSVQSKAVGRSNDNYCSPSSIFSRNEWEI